MENAESLMSIYAAGKGKIKTPFARIIVCGNREKPYYQILYYDTLAKDFHIGFGSFCLDNVFTWLAEEFEIIRDNDFYAFSAPMTDEAADGFIKK